VHIQVIGQLFDLPCLHSLNILVIGQKQQSAWRVNAESSTTKIVLMTILLIYAMWLKSAEPNIILTENEHFTEIFYHYRFQWPVSKSQGLYGQGL
jgi:hypothetical protein